MEKEKNQQQCSRKYEWSIEDINFLKENYKKFSNIVLAEKLKKSKKTIQTQLKKMGLKKGESVRVKLITKSNKIRGRDLTFELVKELALKYKTKEEFYQFDPGAHSAMIKNGWTELICSHMIVGNISLPQLMLRDILETLLGIKCSYNDRKIIYPREIDCYFTKWKIGWEYDGKRYHNDIDDELKRNICASKGVKIFNISEKTEKFRNYETNIKTQLIKQIPEINRITNLQITKKRILDHNFKIIYPNVLTLDEKCLVYGKTMSELKKNNYVLFKKIKKYDLLIEHGIVDDLKKYNRFNSFEEYYEYLKNKNYLTFKDLCKHEHPHRIMKRWNLSIKLINKLFENDNN